MLLVEPPAPVNLAGIGLHPEENGQIRGEEAEKSTGWSRGESARSSRYRGTGSSRRVSAPTRSPSSCRRDRGERVDPQPIVDELNRLSIHMLGDVGHVHSRRSPQALGYGLSIAVPSPVTMDRLPPRSLVMYNAPHYGLCSSPGTTPTSTMPATPNALGSPARRRSGLLLVGLADSPRREIFLLVVGRLGAAAPSSGDHCIRVVLGHDRQPAPRVLCGGLAG